MEAMRGALIVIVASTLACAPQPSASALPAAAQPSASTRPSETLSPAPSPTAAADVLTTFRIEAHGWTPKGPTVFMQIEVGPTKTAPGRETETVFVAVPATGGSPTTLFHAPRRGSFPAIYTWSVNARGVFVLAVPIAFDTARIAIVEPLTGSVRWLAPFTPGTSQLAPIWSADGESVIFGQANVGRGGGTIEQVRLDGTGVRSIQPKGSLDGAFLPAFDSSDGVLLLTEEFNGSQLLAYDRTSGRTTALGSRAQFQSRFGGWRAASPRVLAQTVTSILAPPAGSIVLWDDTRGEVTTLASGAVGAPAFDPVGARIVFGAYDAASTRWRLEVMNANGGERAPLPGTEGAQRAVWSTTGIYFSPTPDVPQDVLVTEPASSTPRRLFHSDDAGQLVVAFRVVGG